MAQIIQTIDIDVPLTTSYNQWTQFEEFPRFFGFVDSITQVDDTHLHWTVTIAGAEREFDAVITEHHPDERVAWTSTGGEVDHGGVVTFHKLSDSSSRIAVQIDWVPEGVLEKLGAATHIPDAAVQRELVAMKNYLEERGTADGAWRGDV